MLRPASLGKSKTERMLPSRAASWAVSMTRGRIRTDGRLLVAILVVGIMTTLSYRLFAGMTTVGMSGVDTFEYWKYANEIIHGTREFVFDRLSFYAINVFALKILGSNDYALRAAVGALAVLNVGLLCILMLRTTGSGLIALATTLLYAFNPVILRYAETELPHIAGAMFVLLSCLFMLTASDWQQPRKRRLAFTFLLGITLTGAVLTHEDLIFLAGGYCIAIALLFFVPPKQPPSGARTREFFLIVLTLAAGVAIGAIWPMLVTGVGPAKIVRDFLALRAAVDQNTAIRTGGAFFSIALPRAITNFTVDSIGWTLTVLVAAFVVVVPVEYVRRRTGKLAAMLSIEVPMVFYVASFLGIGRVYLEGSYQRLFIPLIAPVIAFALSSGFLLFEGRLYRRIALLVLVTITSGVAWSYQPWKYEVRVVTRHRVLYDAVKGLVTPERKLLLPACFALDASWVGIGSKVYLGDNAVSIYLMDQFIGFSELLSAKKIGFVLVPTLPQRGMWPLEQMLRLFAETYGEPITGDRLKNLSQVSQEVWRGDTRVDWSPEVCAFESQVVRRLVERRGGRFVASATGVGDIFELRTAPNP